MTFPDDLKYTSEHEWLRITSAKTDDGKPVCEIGITDFAQGELGELVYIECDTVGETLQKDAIFGTVEAQSIGGRMDLEIVRGKRLDASVHDGRIDGRACRFDGERAVELPGLGGEVSGVKGGGGRHVVGWADTDRWDTYEAGTPDEHRSPRRVGVRWEGERAVELGSPEGPNAMTHAVNEHGIVVGSADVGLGGPKRACRWSVAGSAEWLVATGGSSDATGIDDRGTVIGWVHGDDDRYRPFVSSGSHMRWLSLPGDSAFPKDINNHGWIVGSVSWKSERHRWPREVRAWLWVDGAEQAVALDTLVEHEDERRRGLYHALWIDDDGVIVATVGGPSHAVVLRPR